jgi:hypothetical protein
MTTAARIAVTGSALALAVLAGWTASVSTSVPQGGPMAASTTSYPDARIANGQIEARLYLPDARNGFYRSTRFDWSGVIASLRYEGHEYYGPWFAAVDPPVRDFVYRNGDIVVGAQSAMVGPAEEFRTPQGYESARPGETFVKVGVGVLSKPDDERYSGYANYPIVDPGIWLVETDARSVTTTQEVRDPASGFGYDYRKTVRLADGRPELSIEHSLTNTGRRPIRTRQYNHNFLVLDGAPTSPDFVITLPFEVNTTTPPDSQVAAIEGNRIVYRKTLTGEDRVFFRIQGFGPDPKDYDVRIENRATGAGVRITSDQPLADMSLWSIRSVISLEPDVDINLDPGESMDWTLTYTYYIAR